MVLLRTWRLAAVAIGAVIALIATQLVAAPARADDPIEYHYSTLNGFAAYVQPLTNASGAEVGLRVYYQWAALRTGGSANFSAVCFSANHYACADTTAIAWAAYGSGTVGSWNVWSITFNCAGGAYHWVEVLEPYLSGSGLNFQPWGTAPVVGFNFFNYGSADSAYIPISGCHQVLSS